MAKEVILVNGEPFSIELLSEKDNRIIFQVGGRDYEVGYERSIATTTPAPKTVPQVVSSRGGICAPIPGLVVEVLVQPKDVVQKGQVLLRLEAMKMENNIFAPASGIISEVFVKAGEEVADGQALVALEEESSKSRGKNDRDK